jgi:putative N6-adenine-specific DNA methylase
MENIFKANYLSRLATRVLLPLAEFRCPDKEALYREAKKIDWLTLLDETKTFSIDSHVHHPQIRHSLYAAQVMKDAICDQIRDKKGARPSIDKENPTIHLHLLINNQNALISFDTSGIALYKRGYREHIAEACIQETLAAAILRKSGYNANEVLCDPFCGSGTFLIEAACIATQTPAGFFRKSFGFTHLPAFKEAEWLSFKEAHDQKRVPLEPSSILGADIDQSTLRLCKENVLKAGFEKGIKLFASPVNSLKLPKSPTLVVTNPPFGKRFEASYPLYADLGAFLKRECPATPWAYVLTAAFPLAKATGCPILSEWSFKHGGLSVGLYQIANR